MPILVVLKAFLTPLLALVILAGCVTPATRPSPEGESATVTISVGLPQAGYQTQYLEEDIESLVFGLVDVSATPYLGIADGTSFTAPGHRYHAAIAGNASGGVGLLPGLVGSDTGLLLGDAERANPKRYLYVAASGRASRSMTFASLKPTAEKRFVAFAIAFKKDVTTTAVTSDDAIGLCQWDPFALSAGTLALAPKALALTRGLGRLQINLKVDETDAALSTMSRVVVALMDTAAWSPNLGFEATPGGQVELIDTPGNPVYHQAIAGSPGAPGLFDYSLTALAGNSAAFGNRKRVFYYVLLPGDFGSAPTKTLTFSNLRPGQDYHAFAVALQGNDANALEKGMVQAPSAPNASKQGIEVLANDTVSRDLELKLKN